MIMLEMPEELIMFTVLLLSFLAIAICLSPFIIMGLRFASKFKKLEIGMTYNQVNDIVGKPRNFTIAENIKTCMWKRHVLRGWRISYTITFKNEIVISILNDNSIS